MPKTNRSKDTYIYPVRIRKEKGHAWFIATLIDFNYARTCGKTNEDAACAAQELIASLIMDYENNNTVIPKPTCPTDADVQFIPIYMPYFRSLITNDQ